ncbi:MAG: hypothetical protein GWN01_01920 [Nitrosopumilaceae archaeon]|nr:hypothetical protein [Nitrosopumilaceae archaeon]NIT99730.1 hypothetical protein [Nitrosopumilaceae archaeon]NIV64866.1 hypothetical protein [Nitrosopumilaceae archaeon]NIX60333.1 hypothetical protein [Nitrosopumilaceae archaeon]
MIVTNIFAEKWYQTDSDLTTIRINIHQNFHKAIRLLIKIYGMSCVICGEFAPKSRTKSGLLQHYLDNHRKETAVFIRQNIMTKTPQQLRKLIIKKSNLMEVFV